MMFPNKVLFALALALVVPCAAFAASARPVLDEANAKVMTISTRGATTHQRLTLPLDKAAVVQLDLVLADRPAVDRRQLGARQDGVGDRIGDVIHGRFTTHAG